jgi:hypothetical protein
MLKFPTQLSAWMPRNPPKENRVLRQTATLNCNCKMCLTVLRMIHRLQARRWGSFLAMDNFPRCTCGADAVRTWSISATTGQSLFFVAQKLSWPIPSFPWVRRHTHNSAYVKDVANLNLEGWKLKLWKTSIIFIVIDCYLRQLFQLIKAALNGCAKLLWLIPCVWKTKMTHPLLL